MKQNPPPGQLFVVSAPSGAGKTTITSRLNSMGLARVSVSYTTRARRSREKSDNDYFFVSREAFIAMRDEGVFLEWAEVYGNYYGTRRDWVETQLAEGVNVLLEIDCQGARQISALSLPTVSIFIRPPTLDNLRQRLVERGQDAPEAVEQRLAAAAKEMEQEKYFDYVIINDDLENAIGQAAAIIRRHGGGDNIKENNGTDNS